MSPSPFARRNLLPLIPLIVSEVGLSETTVRRHIGVFDDHLFRLQGRRLPRVGRNRRSMVDEELWGVLVRVYEVWEARKGTVPAASFEEVLAEVYSGEHPRMRSLDDVHDLLTNQRETLLALRGEVAALREDVGAVRAENAKLRALVEAQRRQLDHLLEGLRAVAAVWCRTSPTTSPTRSDGGRPGSPQGVTSSEMRGPSAPGRVTFRGGSGALFGAVLGAPRAAAPACLEARE